MQVDYGHDTQWAIFMDGGDIGTKTPMFGLTSYVSIGKYGVMNTDSKDWNNFVMVF